MRRKTSKRVMIEIDKIWIHRDGYVSLLSSCICPVAMFPEGTESTPDQ